MTIEDDIAFLERVPTFAQLGFSALQIVAIGSEAKQLDDGDVLFRAGDAADAGYVIQHGSLKLLPPDAEGSDAGVIFGPGVLIGEIALLTETIRPVTAIAASLNWSLYQHWSFRFCLSWNGCCTRITPDSSVCSAGWRGCK